VVVEKNMLAKILSVIKSFVMRLNEYGVPLPMVRADGKPSLTATMTIISFMVCIIGQVGKINGWVGGIDDNSALYLFITSLSAYLGRRFQGNAVTKVSTTDAEVKQ
jgi:hypothetical protein